MFKNLQRILAAEVALHKHNQVNRQGVVSPDAQCFHVIEDVLPQEVFEALLELLPQLQNTAVREDSHWRKGQAIGGHELKRSVAAPWLDYFASRDFIRRLRSETDIATLDLVPEADTNRLSMLFYNAPVVSPIDSSIDSLKDSSNSGDGTDWHMDGSIYLGDRWAGILTLVEETGDNSSKLELQPHGNATQIPKHNLQNSLILFQGDHVLHRVRALANGERRVVISLLFSDWPVRTRNPWLRRYQSKVNLAFYGNSNA